VILASKIVLTDELLHSLRRNVSFIEDIFASIITTTLLIHFTDLSFDIDNTCKKRDGIMRFSFKKHDARDKGESLNNRDKIF
jgi:hypothetical protein